MSLVPSALELALLGIFKEMNGENPMTDEQYANKVATAITDYIKTATVSTTVTGTATAGTVAGTGVGTIS